MAARGFDGIQPSRLLGPEAGLTTVGSPSVAVGIDSRFRVMRRAWLVRVADKDAAQLSLGKKEKVVNKSQESV